VTNIDTVTPLAAFKFLLPALALPESYQVLLPMAFRAPLARIAVTSSKGVVAHYAPAASRFYTQAAAVPTSSIGTDISKDDIKVHLMLLLSR